MAAPRTADPLLDIRRYARAPLALLDHHQTIGLSWTHVAAALCCQADRWAGRAYDHDRLTTQLGCSRSHTYRLLARAAALGACRPTPTGPDWEPLWHWCHLVDAGADPRRARLRPPPESPTRTPSLPQETRSLPQETPSLPHATPSLPQETPGAPPPYSCNNPRPPEEGEESEESDQGLITSSPHSRHRAMLEAARKRIAGRQIPGP